MNQYDWATILRHMDARDQFVAMATCKYSWCASESLRAAAAAIFAFRARNNGIINYEREWIISCDADALALVNYILIFRKLTQRQIMHGVRRVIRHGYTTTLLAILKRTGYTLDWNIAYENACRGGRARMVCDIARVAAQNHFKLDTFCGVLGAYRGNHYDLIARGIIPPHEFTVEREMQKLISACEGGHINLITMQQPGRRSLLELYATESERFADLARKVMYAIGKRGNANILQLILRACSANIDWQGIFDGACYGGHVEILQMALTNSQCDIECGLQNACIGHHCKIVEFLLPIARERHVIWDSVALSAYACGNARIIGMVRAHFPAITQEVLHGIAINGHVELIQFAMKHNSAAFTDINIEAMIEVAAQWNHVEFARVLLTIHSANFATYGMKRALWAAVDHSADIAELILAKMSNDFARESLASRVSYFNEKKKWNAIAFALNHGIYARAHDPPPMLSQ
jgi:hypothetical protein